LAKAKKSASKYYSKVTFSYIKKMATLASQSFNNWRLKLWVLDSLPRLRRGTAVSSAGNYNFAWDNNGNMTQRSANNVEGTWRNLCWDEENRLMGVTDFSEGNPDQTSAYVYNAGGERVWKFSGDIQQMTINGNQLINIANITNKTLYSSPYLVANDNNYTKHYFIESERVCSKIGGGFSNPIDPINQAIIEPINSGQPTISGNFTQHIINSISCTNTESPELNVDPVLRGIEDFIGIDENEDLQYFFVIDHLGSSSFYNTPQKIGHKVK